MDWFVNASPYPFQQIFSSCNLIFVFLVWNCSPQQFNWEFVHITKDLSKAFIFSNKHHSPTLSWDELILVNSDPISQEPHFYFWKSYCMLRLASQMHQNLYAHTKWNCKPALLALYWMFQTIWNKNASAASTAVCIMQCTLMYGLWCAT